jgi:hypothetical protein
VEIELEIGQVMQDVAAAVVTAFGCHVLEFRFQPDPWECLAQDQGIQPGLRKTVAAEPRRVFRRGRLRARGGGASSAPRSGLPDRSYQDFVTATITQFVARHAIEARISGAKC